MRGRLILREEGKKGGREGGQARTSFFTYCICINSIRTIFPLKTFLTACRISLSYCSETKLISIASNAFFLSSLLIPG